MMFTELSENPVMRDRLRSLPFPLVFVTVTGSHLYGFPSHDSDYDLRGVHVIPLLEILGMYQFRDTVTLTEKEKEPRMDLILRDVRDYIKFLWFEKNGDALEQLVSPLVVYTTPAHDELVALVPRMFTRNHANYYLGYAKTQWDRFINDDILRAKRLIYVYRSLMTAIYLMRTKEFVLDLIHLNSIFKLPYIPDLVERKIAGVEYSSVPQEDISFYQAEYRRLEQELELARKETKLPNKAPARKALNDLLIRIRMDTQNE